MRAVGAYREICPAVLPEPLAESGAATPQPKRSGDWKHILSLAFWSAAALRRF
jgi:hypothetical protein